MPRIAVISGFCFALFAASIAQGARQPLALKNPAVPKKVAVENPPLYPLSKVKAGQRGMGYTVFSSRLGPEPFDFEVLGIMRNYLGPGADLIIARLIGEKIEKTGVISGMSGSPAYIDGRLVGAVGYRFGSFTDEAIAGITPIDGMLASFQPTSMNTGPVASVGSQKGHGPTPWGEATPIAVPIMTQGLTPEVANTFAPLFKERGYGPLIPGAGGGGGSKSGGKGERFYAGGPIAGILVDGDINMAGVGTVTWVKDNRFLAFGHPFLGIGESAMVVKNAEIITTVSSKAGSWKMGQPTTEVGRLFHDRLFAIAGEMGHKAPRIPMTLTFAPQKGAKVERMSFAISPHPTDVPLFAAIAVANALSNRTGRELGGTWTVSGKAALKSGQEIKFSRVLVDEKRGMEIPTALTILDEVGDLVDQSFADVKLQKLDLKVERNAGVHLQRLVGLDVPDAVKPGKKAKIRLRVAPWKKPLRDLTLEVRIPAGLSPGNYRLKITDRRGADSVERNYGMRPQALDLATYLQNRQRRASDKSLSVFLLMDKRGPLIDGQAMPGLPITLQGLIGEGDGISGGDTVSGHALRIWRRDMPFVVYGTLNTTLRVRAE